jgi:hypothetical protein
VSAINGPALGSGYADAGLSVVGSLTIEDGVFVLISDMGGGIGTGYILDGQSRIDFLSIARGQFVVEGVGFP